MESRFATLRDMHQVLLNKYKAAEQQKNAEALEKVIEEVKAFLPILGKGGNSISDRRQRDLLQKYLNLWTPIVYARTGCYPSDELADYSGKLPWRVWVAVAVAIVVAVVVVAPIIMKLSPLVLNYLSTMQSPQVYILLPRNGDSVPHQIEISGRHEGNLAGQTIWVIIRPEGSERSYPQRPANPRVDRTWFVTASLGKEPPEDSGKVFDILVYLSDDKADQELRKYVNDATQTGVWQGFPDLPEGLTPVGDPVKVTRQSSPTDVQILQPGNQDSVAFQAEVSGRYEGNLAERKIWVIVHPQGSDLLYPQSRARMQGGSWSVAARFGSETPEEVGKKFEILACLANNQADQILEKYVKEAQGTGNWGGITSLPSGLTVEYSLVVSRR